MSTDRACRSLPYTCIYNRSASVQHRAHLIATVGEALHCPHPPAAALNGISNVRFAPRRPVCGGNKAIIGCSGTSACAAVAAAAAAAATAEWPFSRGPC